MAGPLASDAGVGGAGVSTTHEPDLRAQLHVLRRYKWVVLACAVLLPVVVYFLASHEQKIYEGKATLQVQSQGVDTSLFIPEFQSFAPPAQALSAAARLTTTTKVAGLAAKKLHEPSADTLGLSKEISVTEARSAGFLTIVAADPDPARAAAVANAFAAALVQVRATQAKQQIDSAISQVEQDLANLPPSDSQGHSQLSQQLQRLRALKAAQGYNAQIIQKASPPTNPVSPHPLRDAVIALAIGLLLGVGLAFLINRLDRRIRDAEELEQLTGAPLLGIMPEAAFPGERPSPAVPEAFQMLAASLTYFNVDRPLKTVLIASPLKGDGKTTVSTLLSTAIARAGKDVILVDADLRDPDADVRLGSRAKVGLGGVLAGEVELHEALHDLDTEGGHLRILPSGSPPPNPAELIASQRMRSLLVELGQHADIVIVDTPAALAVGDTITLFEQASGVVLVGRLGWTRRDAIRRLAAVIANARGHLLGVVATGAGSSALYAYGGYEAYGYGYGAKAKADDGASGNGAPAPAPQRKRLFR